MRITDPRTGHPAYIHDENAYHEELAAVTAECTHERHELRRFSNKNDTFAVAGQCFSCGQRVGNSVKAANRNSIPLADPALETAYWANWKARRNAVAVKHIDLSDARDAAFWSDYDAYLQTPEWKGRRAKVLRRCGGVCEGCADAVATVVHHLTYVHVFDELLFELVGLCGSCHEKAHANPKAQEAEPEVELDF